MVDIQSATSEIRPGKQEEERRTNDRMKYIWPAPLHRAAINKNTLPSLPGMQLGNFNGNVEL